MSGLVGLYHLDGRPADRPQLEALAAGSSSASRRLDVRIVGSFGIACQPREIAPDPRRGLQPTSPSAQIVSFDGRLDNREQFSATFRSYLDGVCSDAALVAAAQHESPETFVSRLAGDFALAAFDARSATLTLARDRMGARPLYYAVLKTTIVFGSTVASILAHPEVVASPDEDALADLAFDGYSEADRTCFLGVSSVPAGHAVVVSRAGLAVRAHWDFDTGREIRYRAFDEYVSHFRSLFAQAVRVRVGAARTAVAVSGGVDSSAIFGQALALARHGASPRAIEGLSMVFPFDSPAHERPFLDEVERAFGVSVTKLPVGRMRILPHAERLIRAGEMPALEWDARAQLVAAARARGCGVLLDGYFGDHLLFDRSYLIDLVRSGRWPTVRAHIRQFPQWMTEVDAPLFRRQFLSSAIRGLPPRWLFYAIKNRLSHRRAAAMSRWYTPPFVRRAVSRALDRRPPARRFVSYHAEQMYRLATSGHDRVQRARMAAVGVAHGVDIVHPFRDRELVAFVMAIPGDIVNRGGVPKALLREASTGIVPDVVRQRTSKADFTAANTEAFVGEFDAICALLTRDCASARAGIVDGAVLQDELRRYRSQLPLQRTAALTRRVTELLSVELWLRTFFGSTLS